VRFGTLILLSLFTVAACFARETVYLASGFSITADSHTIADGIYVLHVGGGTLEYPESAISGITPLPESPIPASDKAVSASSPAPQAILKTAADSEGVDEIFVRSVAKIESGLRQEAISRKGALGLMQLMPGTAAELGVDAKKADQNASGGARYLRTLLERYHYNPVLALAAYNAGPGAVMKYRGLPPYYETRTYVVRVLKEYQRELKLAGIRPDDVNSAGTAKTPSATN